VIVVVVREQDVGLDGAASVSESLAQRSEARTGVEDDATGSGADLEAGSVAAVAPGR
jgi:hypothetical protein